MSRDVTPVLRTDPPLQSTLAPRFADADFCDAYAVALPPGADGDAEVLARHVFSQQGPWVGWLLAMRDSIVGRLGLKTVADLGSSPEQDRISIFRVYQRLPDEIVIGEDDTHLDFRVSIMVDGTDPGKRRVVVTTAVFYNRLLGQMYMRVIAPVHRLVVRDALRRAARRGWPDKGDPRP